MTKFYIASLFGEIAETKLKARLIEDTLGWSCTARWVDGGEEGLSRADIALLDLEDVDKADTLVLISHPRGEPKPGGGRWVEFGYALAKGLRLFVVGPYENVFVHHPNVTVYPTISCMVADMERV